MPHPGSRVALLRFRNTEIIPEELLQKVCKETNFDSQKDLVHATFKDVQVQCDATHRRLVEKLKMCKNSLNIGL